MTKQAVFTKVAAELAPVFEELRRREPIFHTPEFGATVADFEKATAPDYWEVGASGRRYSREFIVRTLDRKDGVDAAAAGWHSHGLRRLGPDTHLLTYTLRQGERVTRRATIWEKAGEGWRVLYHQGTVVLAEEDDVVPT
jgi:hypothetical protein